MSEFCVCVCVFVFKCKKQCLRLDIIQYFIDIYIRFTNYLQYKLELEKKEESFMIDCLLNFLLLLKKRYQSF